MKPIHPSEVRSNADYEIARAGERERVMAIKRARRVHVGEHLTLLFENHATLLYQVQEMVRVEGLTKPQQIRHEIDTYNELMPATDELSATLLIEYEDPDLRDRQLRKLLGLESHVSLVVEGLPPCRAEFDAAQMSAERISSVHYVRFPLGRERAEALRAGAAVAIEVDHPQLRASAVLTEQQRGALSEDLATD